jgi:nitrite reductase/ring-hydroxylating ferredoxin subunit
MGNVPVAQPEPRPRRDDSRQVATLALLGIVLVAVVGVVLAFAWPQGGSGPWTTLGETDDFAPGSVTTFSEHDLHLVRLTGGEFLALSREDPGDGCTVPWRAEFKFKDRTGWFRNPCHASTYDMSGACVSGPCVRGLDQYVLRVHEGEVQVDTSSLFRGPAAGSSGGSE